MCQFFLFLRLIKDVICLGLFDTCPSTAKALRVAPN